MKRSLGEEVREITGARAWEALRFGSEKENEKQLEGFEKRDGMISLTQHSKTIIQPAVWRIGSKGRGERPLE